MTGGGWGVDMDGMMYWHLVIAIDGGNGRKELGYKKPTISRIVEFHRDAYIYFLHIEPLLIYIHNFLISISARLS